MTMRAVKASTNKTQFLEETDTSWLRSSAQQKKKKNNKKAWHLLPFYPCLLCLFLGFLLRCLWCLLRLRLRLRLWFRFRLRLRLRLRWFRFRFRLRLRLRLRPRLCGRLLSVVCAGFFSTSSLFRLVLIFVRSSASLFSFSFSSSFFFSASLSVCTLEVIEKQTLNHITYFGY